MRGVDGGSVSALTLAVNNPGALHLIAIVIVDCGGGAWRSVAGAGEVSLVESESQYNNSRSSASLGCG